VPKAVCAKHHVAYEVDQGCLDCVPPTPEYIETDEPLMFSTGNYYGVDIGPRGDTNSHDEEFLW
jgi:hypothetical protein